MPLDSYGTKGINHTDNPFQVLCDHVIFLNKIRNRTKIYGIYLSVTGEVSLQTNCSLLTEVLGEHVTGTTSNTFWVSHFVRFCLSENIHIITDSAYTL